MPNEEMITETETTAPEDQAPQEEPKKEEKPKPELKYSDDDVDRIINQAIAKERKRNEDKLAQEKKKLSEAQKLEKMNDDEKTKYELENLRKEKAELQAKIDFDEQKKIARATLAEANINIPDELLDMIVSEDADKTKTSVDAFKAQWQSALNKGIEDALKRNPPKAEPKAKGGKSAGELAADRHNAKYQIATE